MTIIGACRETKVNVLLQISHHPITGSRIRSRTADTSSLLQPLDHITTGGESFGC